MRSQAGSKSMIFPNKSQPHAVLASTQLTDAYVAGTIISVDEANMIGIIVTYVKGDETSIELKVESSIDAGSTYYQQLTQSASGGTVTIVPAIYSMTAASAAATQRFTFIINPIKGDTIKISVKETGGTLLPEPLTGTCAIDMVTGWV